MRRKFFGLALSTLLLALCFPVDAQQQAKIPKIGFLRVRLAASGTSLDVFVRELRALGYVEGRNITLSSLDPLKISSIGSPLWPMNCSSQC